MDSKSAWIVVYGMSLCLSQIKGLFSIIEVGVSSMQRLASPLSYLDFLTASNPIMGSLLLGDKWGTQYYMSLSPMFTIIVIWPCISTKLICATWDFRGELVILTEAGSYKTITFHSKTLIDIPTHMSNMEHDRWLSFSCLKTF